MHQIKCAGILGWKKVSQLISRHSPARPRFRIIFVLFYWSFQCNFVSFLTIRNAAGCPTKYFLWILNKRPAAGALFQCLDRRQKEVIPSIWSPLKNRHYTFKTKHCFIFSILHVFCFFSFLYYFFFYLLFVYYFFYFSLFFFMCFILFVSVFPRKFLQNLMNFRGKKENKQNKKNNKIKRHFFIYVCFFFIFFYFFQFFLLLVFFFNIF